MKISDSHVLITGGVSGIGRVLVEHFAQHAARVAVLDIEAPDDELRASNTNTIWVSCDVASPEKVAMAIEQLAEQEFRFDVLVNNAGIIHSSPLINVLNRESRLHPIEQWRRVIAVNLDSVFYMTREVVDRMLQLRRKGVVVNISSIAACGNPGQSAYSAAKAGVIALTKTWAKELGPLGLRFVAVSPGFLDTPSTHAALSSAIVDSVKQSIPLRRLGQPENVLQAVCSIIENDYLNGTVLEVDGGLVI